MHNCTYDLSQSSFFLAIYVKSPALTTLDVKILASITHEYLQLRQVDNQGMHDNVLPKINKIYA